MKSRKWPPIRRADAAFELIDVIAARLDRLILYRVSLLHSGWFTRLPAGTEHLGSGLVDHSQKMIVAARATAEKKAVGQRS